MIKHRWEIWVDDKEKLEKDFNNYLRKKVIREQATKLEVEGHLKKAKRNLRFARRIIEDLKDYYGWSIVAYYYATYHAALSLCADKGLKTKSHLATISILIRSYYPDSISKRDIKTIANIAFGKRDIKEFVELKNYREDVAYGISIDYEKSLAENLGSKAIDFVNKTENILKKD